MSRKMASCHYVLPARKTAAGHGGGGPASQYWQPHVEEAAQDDVTASIESDSPTPPASDQLRSTASAYRSIPVDVKDPLSRAKPLKPFDRSAFETAFPPPSTATISTSPRPPDYKSYSAPASLAADSAFASPATSASSPSSSPRAEEYTQDPFFYPLLPENERRRLSEFWYLTAGIHDDASLAEYLRTLLTLVRDMYGFDVALLQFIDNDRSSSLSPDGWQSTCYPRRETGCAHTMLLEPGTILSVDDFLDDWRFKKNPQIATAQMRSYAGVPLAYTIQSTGESVSLGSLCVFSLNSRKPSLSAAQQSSLVRFAELAVQAIRDRMRLRRDAMQTIRHEHLSVLTKFAGPPSAVVQTTLDTLQDAFGGAQASFVEATNGCLQLNNVGRVPLSAFADDIWENGQVIEDFIKYHNHESSLDYEVGCTVRAIATPLANASNHYLLVQTDRLRDIYDGSDALFVRSCAMVISGSIQGGLLSHALEAKTSFLRNVQHAFRTSLNGILSATDMLLQEDIIQPDNASEMEVSHKNGMVDNTTPFELLNIIETSGRGLLTVVNHLFDLDAQGIAASVDICDIHDIEEEVLDAIVQHSAKDRIKDILLVSDSHLNGTTGDCIMSDRLLLKQATAALVRNAVEATVAGGMVTVHFALTNEPGGFQNLDIEVRDTGCGISKADQTRIFLPFEKIDKFTPNAGLGLAFASQYVATLGGSIELVESSLGKGSVFRIRLSNPVLASSLQNHKARTTLPAGWTYWMNSTQVSHDMGDVYGRSLEMIGIKKASSKRDATLLVQPMSLSATHTEIPDDLASDQMLLMLGWEADYHSKPRGREAVDRTVYGRLPWTRRRLFETISQAQKLFTMHVQAMEHRKASNAIGQVSGNFTPSGPAQIRALLVDDNAMNLNILQAYCKKRKYDFESARDGQDAFNVYVKACESGKAPNICLLDLQMPVCDGLACAQLIRAYESRENRTRCPIIMVTAQSGDADRRSSLAAGTDAYYVKPLRISTLDDIVARYARA